MYACRDKGLSRDGTPHFFGCGGYYPRNLGHDPLCVKAQYWGPTLEEMVIKGLLFVAQSPDVLDAALEAYNQSRVVRTPEKQRVKIIRGEITALERRGLAAAQAAIEARIAGASYAVYEDARREAEAKRVALEAELSALVAPDTTQGISVPHGQISAVTQALADPETPPETRREIYQLLIDRIYPQRGNTSRRNTFGAIIVLRTNAAPPWWVVTVRRTGTITVDVTETKRWPDVPPRRSSF